MTRRGSLLTAVAAIAVAGIVLTTRGAAQQVVVSATDRKVVLVDGVQTVVADAPPDTIALVDVGASPPRLLSEIAAPASVIGPPSSVAITPDGRLALVTAAMKIDPANRSQLTLDDRVSVIDLAAAPPAVIATLTAGPGPSGIAVNRAGSLALVANRGNGTIAVFSITGRDVKAAGTVDLGAPGSIPSAIVFSADGRRAFVTRNGDSLISVLAVEGTQVTYTKTDFGAAFKPYPFEVTPAGDLAVVGHVGAGASGGEDLISLIDLTPALPRAIAHVSAGSTVEGLAISPDGRHVAATVMNGTQFPKASPNFNDFGRLRIFRIESRSLVPAAETRIGRWCQGVAWSGDGRRVVAQCPVERELQVFAFDGRALTAAGAVSVSGSPVGIRSRP